MVNYGGFDEGEAEIQAPAVPIQMQYREEGHYSVSSGFRPAVDFSVD